MDPSGRTNRLRRLWVWLAIFALAATSGAIWMVIGRTRAHTLRVTVHASHKGDDGASGGPPRLVAELPARDEARVSSRDSLQLSYAGLTSPAFATVVAIDETGAEHPYLPRPDAEPLQVPPARQPHDLGPPIYLGRQRPGRFRLFVVFTEGPLEARAVREAAARSAARGQPEALDGIAGAAVSGVLVIEP